MKNTIKIVIIFEIVTFFSVYPMDRAVVKLDTLGKIGNFINESDFAIKREAYRDWENIPANSSLYTDLGLSLTLTAITFRKEFSENKCEKILKTIRNAVGEGRTSLISNFVFRVGCFSGDDVYISPSKEPTSIFCLAGNLFEESFIGEDICCIHNPMKRPWMGAIFQGYEDRKKNHLRMSDALRVGAEDVLQINLSDNLSLFITSYLSECNISKKDKTLIKEAKQKLDKEQ